MGKRSLSFILCILIIGISLFFRFYRLSEVPISLSLDEVSIGYNAYSILKTGGDEYGARFPLLLRSYDDYRPALYVYTVIPFIAVFGLTPLSVRIPSVICGTVSVIAVYFLVKELLFGLKPCLSAGRMKDERLKIKKSLIINHASFINCVPLLSSFFLAISPWHIYFSRLGHEVNLSLAGTIIGLTLFFVALRKKDVWFAVASSFSFALTFYTYQSMKITTPLLVCALCVLFGKDMWKEKKIWLAAFFIGILFTIPIAIASFEPNALIRFSGTHVFSDNAIIHESAQKILKAKNNNDTIGVILNNRRILGLRLMASGYISHFSPLWLFAGGEKEVHKVPLMGLLPQWFFLCIPIGFFAACSSQRIRKKAVLFLLLWIVIAPLPAAITTQTPHAMRASLLFPVFSIVSSIGLWWVLERSKGFFRSVVLLLFMCCVALTMIRFSYQYFTVFRVSEKDSFQYGLHRVLQSVIPDEHLYDHIVVSNKDLLFQSYMFYLFASAYDPFLYQRNGGTLSGGFKESHRIGKWEFREIDWTVDREQKNTLFIGNPHDFLGLGNQSGNVVWYKEEEGICQVLVL